MKRIALRGLAVVVYCLASLPAVAVEYRWTLVKNPAAFAPRDGAGALTFNGQMWLLGGWNPNDKVNFPQTCNSEVWSSTDGSTWTERVAAAPWEGRHTAGYAVLDNKMWIVGGDPLQGHYQSDVWSTSDGVNWTQATPNAPWGQRCLHYTVVHDGKIWVMGGQTAPQFAPASEAFYNDVWNSSDGVNWTRVTEHAEWSPRGMIGGAVELNGRMWLLGGGTYDTPEHPNRLFYNEVWSSADGMSWQRDLAAAPWNPRQYHDVAVFDGKMWVMEGGNYDTPGYNLNDVWYSSDGVNWSELPDTPWAPRHAASVFVHDNALWMVAGNNMQSDVWRLDAVHAPEPTICGLLVSGFVGLGGWQMISRRSIFVEAASCRFLKRAMQSIAPMTRQDAASTQGINDYQPVEKGDWLRTDK